MDSFVFLFTTIQGLFIDTKHFGKDLDLNQIDPTHELCSENTKRAIVKMKLESYPGIELDEAVILSSKSYNTKKPLNGIETKHKGAQSHNKNKRSLKKILRKKNERAYGHKNSFGSKQHEVSMVKQP